MRFVQLGIANALIACVLLACGPQAPVNQTTFDLVENHDTLELLHDDGELSLGNEDKYLHLAEGWSYPLSEQPDDKASVAMVLDEASLRFRVFRRSHRWLRFNYSFSYNGWNLANQQIEILLNGTRVDSFSIEGPETNEHFTLLPEEYLERGINTVVFRCEQSVENESFMQGSHDEIQKWPYKAFHGLFSGFEIYGGNKQRPQSRPFAKSVKFLRYLPEPDVLIQRANSQLITGLQVTGEAALSAKAEIRFTADETQADLRFFACGEDNQWRLLTGKTVEGNGDSAGLLEERLELSAEGYLAVRIEVSTSQAKSRIQVIWKELEIIQQEPPSTTPVERSYRHMASSSNIHHVVIIMPDALRADAVSSENTPAIAGLAKKSLRFTNAAASAPYTVASVASLLTSLNPYQHGVNWFGDAFPAELANLPSALSEAGFHSSVITGHNIYENEKGFGELFDSVHPIADYSNIRYSSEMDEAKMAGALKETVTEHEKSFTLVHLIPPHEPYDPPSPFSNAVNDLPMDEKRRLWQYNLLYQNGLIDENHQRVRTLRQRYQANVRYADHLVQQILETLEEAEVMQHTAIILLSDHGEAFLEHGFMQHTRTVYEEMIRVPLIIHYPGAEAAQIDRQAGVIDVFPAILDLLAISHDLTAEFEGRSLFSLMQPEQTPDAGRWLFSQSTRERRVYSLRGDQFKFISSPGNEYLYDLENDPGETRCVAEENQALFYSLRTMGILINNLPPRSNEQIDIDEKQRDTLRDLGYLQ